MSHCLFDCCICRTLWRGWQYLGMRSYPRARDPQGDLNTSSDSCASKYRNLSCETLGKSWILHCLCHAYRWVHLSRRNASLSHEKCRCRALAHPKTWWKNVSRRTRGPPLRFCRRPILLHPLQSQIHWRNQSFIVNRTCRSGCAPRLSSPRSSIGCRAWRLRRRSRRWRSRSWGQNRTLFGNCPSYLASTI